MPAAVKVAEDRNCREYCKWAMACILPGEKGLDPHLCYKARQLQDCWSSPEEAERWIRDMEMRHKYLDGDYEPTYIVRGDED